MDQVRFRGPGACNDGFKTHLIGKPWQMMPGVTTFVGFRMRLVARMQPLGATSAMLAGCPRVSARRRAAVGEEAASTTQL
jgi:hypothetical protein